MKYLKPILIVASMLLLSACSNPYAVHYDNLKLAFLLNEDADLSFSEVQESDVDLALIKSGDRPVAIIAKAYDEFGKGKWISKDRAMLVLEQYRITRTVGFKNDQLEILSGEPDPLSSIATVNGKEWDWQVDWSVGEYGYAANSAFNVGAERISMLDHDFNVLLVTETVTYQNDKSIFSAATSWQNFYWIDKASGKLLKTQQKHAPFADEFTIRFVSNAARLLSDRG